ncbi:MAG: hypothetical protein JSU59_08935, partial [Nitrospirota bacterium]
MSLRLLFAYALIVGLLLPGCMGTGEVINLEVQPLRTPAVEHTDPMNEALVIAVDTFKDGRPDTKRVGVRTHFWGGITNFNAWNGEIGEGMANLSVAYLKQHNWNASRLGGSSASSSPDATLSGKVLTWDSRAKSGFGFTEIDVTMKVLFEVTNEKDGSTVRMVLGSNGSDTVVFFNSEDVRTLTNQVAKQLFEQLFRDLKVK